MFTPVSIPLETTTIRKVATYGRIYLPPELRAIMNYLSGDGSKVFGYGSTVRKWIESILFSTTTLLPVKTKKRSDFDLVVTTPIEKIKQIDNIYYEEGRSGMDLFQLHIYSTSLGAWIYIDITYKKNLYLDEYSQTLDFWMNAGFFDVDGSIYANDKTLNDIKNKRMRTVIPNSLQALQSDLKKFFRAFIIKNRDGYTPDWVLEHAILTLLQNRNQFIELWGKMNPGVRNSLWSKWFRPGATTFFFHLLGTLGLIGVCFPGLWKADIKFITFRLEELDRDKVKLSGIRNILYIYAVFIASLADLETELYSRTSITSTLESWGVAPEQNADSIVTDIVFILKELFPTIGKYSLRKQICNISKVRLEEEKKASEPKTIEEPKSSKTDSAPEPTGHISKVRSEEEKKASEAKAIEEPQSSKTDPAVTIMSSAHKIQSRSSLIPPSSRTKRLATKYSSKTIFQVGSQVEQQSLPFKITLESKEEIEINVARNTLTSCIEQKHPFHIEYDQKNVFIFNCTLLQSKLSRRTQQINLTPAEYLLIPLTQFAQKILNQSQSLSPAARKIAALKEILSECSVSAKPALGPPIVVVEEKIEEIKPTIFVQQYHAGPAVALGVDQLPFPLDCSRDILWQLSQVGRVYYATDQYGFGHWKLASSVNFKSGDVIINFGDNYLDLKKIVELLLQPTSQNGVHSQPTIAWRKKSRRLNQFELYATSTITAGESLSLDFKTISKNIIQYDQDSVSFQLGLDQEKKACIKSPKKAILKIDVPNRAILSALRVNQDFACMTPDKNFVIIISTQVLDQVLKRAYPSHHYITLTPQQYLLFTKDYFDKYYKQQQASSGYLFWCRPYNRVLSSMDSLLQQHLITPKQNKITWELNRIFSSLFPCGVFWQIRANGSHTDYLLHVEPSIAQTIVTHLNKALSDVATISAESTVLLKDMDAEKLKDVAEYSFLKRPQQVIHPSKRLPSYFTVPNTRSTSLKLLCILFFLALGNGFLFYVDIKHSPADKQKNFIGMGDCIRAFVASLLITFGFSSYFQESDKIIQGKDEEEKIHLSRAPRL